MTNEEHERLHEKKLHVHRLLPGSIYLADWCVTLCIACHGKKVKKMEAALFSDDLRWFALNLYDEQHRRLWSHIRDIAAASNVRPGEALSRILDDYFKSQPPDYVI